MLLFSYCFLILPLARLVFELADLHGDSFLNKFEILDGDF